MTEPHAPAEKRRMILVVDDEDGIRSLLERLLARLPKPPPVQIVTVPSAEHALEVLEQTRVDLILSDFNMGGKDGIQLLATARERWPGTVRMLMTGYTDDQVYQEAHARANVAAFIRKPWHTQDLLKIIDHLLREREGHGSAAGPAIA